MMTLRGFSLILTTVLMRHFAQAENAPSARSAILMVVAYCVGFAVLSKVNAVACLMLYPNFSRGFVWQKFELRRSGLEWFWIGGLPWAMSLSGYGATLASAQTNGWPQSVIMFAWLAPSLLFLFALDFSTVQLEDSLATSGAPHTWRVRSVPGPLSRWLLRVRLGGTGGVVMGILPVLFVLLGMDLTQILFPSISEGLRAVVAVAFLALSCLTLAPLMMKVWMAARPIEPQSPLAHRVVELCRAVRVPVPQLLRVHSRGAWHGAALVGWTRLGRQLWLGDGVCNSLSAPELDMVILHELAHLRRGHCWWRLLPLLSCAIMAVVGIADPWFGLLIGAIGMLWALGRISRYCELDADRFACHYAQQHCQWADGSRQSAAQSLVGALRRLHGPQVDTRQRYWLHPTLVQRARSLGTNLE